VEFRKSADLIAAIAGLFYQGKHGAFERIRGKYAALKKSTSALNFLEFLVDLRGELQHANLHTSKKWHPSRQEEFKDEAVCILNVADRICRQMAIKAIKEAVKDARASEKII
jgi:hypothetical protein